AQIPGRDDARGRQTGATRSAPTIRIYPIIDRSIAVFRPAARMSGLKPSPRDDRQYLSGSNVTLVKWIAKKGAVVSTSTSSRRVDRTGSTERQPITPSRSLSPA